MKDFAGSDTSNEQETMIHAAELAAALKRHESNTEVPNETVPLSYHCSPFLNVIINDGKLKKKRLKLY